MFETSLLLYWPTTNYEERRENFLGKDRIAPSKTVNAVSGRPHELTRRFYSRT